MANGPLTRTDPTGLDGEEPQEINIPVIPPGKPYPKWEDLPLVPDNAKFRVPGAPKFEELGDAFKVGTAGGIVCNQWGRGARWGYRRKEGCTYLGFKVFRLFGRLMLCPWPRSGTCTKVTVLECKPRQETNLFDRVGGVLVWKEVEQSGCKDKCKK